MPKEANNGGFTMVFRLSPTGYTLATQCIV